jgi:Lrp/AsnC family transcriptional regulator, leucine-responsive regulatory protein
MIDNLDKNILVELSRNCRQSTNQIARKLKKSKNTVLYRINRMEKEGIISKYQTIVDFSKTGQTYARFALKLLNNTKSEHAKAIDFLMKEKNVCWLGSVQGKSHITFVFLYRSLPELTIFSDKLKETLGKNIENMHLSTLHRLYYCNNNFVRQTLDRPSIIEYYALSDYTDKLDKEILRLLQQNAKISIIEMSKILGCNDKTLLYRIKNLIKKKVIIKFRIEINAKSLGLESYHLFWEFYDMNHESSLKFRNYLLEMPNTTYISEAIGSLSSFESDMIVKDSQELYTNLDILKERFPDLIKGFDPMIILKVHKAF